jgi:hypothetical protein
MHRFISLFIVLLLSGCAISAAIYKSGIKFEGLNVVKNTFGYHVNLDLNKKIDLKAGGCDQYSQQGMMVSPLIPLPPVIPVDDGEPKSNVNELLSFVIISWKGDELNTSSNYLLLSLDGVSTKVTISNISRNELAKDIITYKYQTNIKCGSIKDATLEVKGFQESNLIYKLKYYEGTEFEAGYLSA